MIQFFMSLIVFLSLSMAVAAPATKTPSPLPTKEELYRGSDVPERREFPVDPKISPCSDLYQYACHNVMDSFKLREDRSSHTFSFNDSSERLLTAKKNYLEYLNKNTPPTERGQTLKALYSACMNEKESAKEERYYVQKELQRLNRIKSRDELLTLVANRIDDVDHSLVGFAVLPNQADPSRRDVLFDADLMTLPERSYYSDEALLADFHEVLVTFFKTLKMAHPEKHADNVLAFEKAYAQKYPLPSEFRERLTQNNYLTSDEFQNKYPQFKLTRFLKRLPKGTQFRNLTPEAFDELNQFLAAAPLETIKDIVLFGGLNEYMDDAYQTYYQKKFDFNKKHLGGPNVRPVRNERCTRMIMSDFGRELDAELVPLLFPDFPSDKVVAMAEKIRQSIVEDLKKNKWLSSQGKAGAIKKMETAELLLVQPRNDEEWYFNPPAKYSALKKYTNKRLLDKNLIDRRVRELGEPRNRRRWLMSPLTVNAYYTPMDNVFVLPIGILQYPFYDPSLPEYVNMAAIGTVVGHELGHGIDDKGAKYDETGKLRTWMSDDDIKKFKESGSRFIKRFDKIGHNGTLTLGENIGDHVGLSASYEAAMKTPNFGKEEKQKFFTQYARSWCSVMRPKMRERLLKTDVHALGEARVNEQVKHAPGFYEAFACKKSDPMFLPESERIKVW